MMRRRIWLIAATLACLPGAWADESVVNSKHDLSTLGPGPIRAVDESRVCIFCHTPHNASADAPLWNRHNPTTHYRIYRSSTIDARIDQPGLASKMCLSCHDGSIALGLTLDRPLTDPIPMTHSYMPSGPSNLTNDLSDDHPIGLRYDRMLSNRDPQLRPVELVDHRIALGERNELECVACHDPHNNELGDFLRIPQLEGALCTTCHEMYGWELSSHALSPRSVPITATQGDKLPYRSMADNACRACHLSHSAPEREHLLYDRGSLVCLNCHDGIGGQNILPVTDQRSGHRISRVYGQMLPSLVQLRGLGHVQCTDCHNPHAVRGELARGALNTNEGGLLAPPALRGASGVSISGMPVDHVVFSYEVCFKCHGDLAVQLRARVVRQRDELGNVRREFLPTTASAHPVALPARRAGDVPSLVASQRSRRFIGCQDCHNNPDSIDAGGLQVNGPHTSRFDNLLVRRYETSDYTVESPQSYALCYECHDRTSILGDESFSLHNRHVVRGRTPCSACHASHGVNGNTAQHSHLINFDLAIVEGQRFYVDTGDRRGSCTLNCHGVDHVNFTYSP